MNEADRKAGAVAQYHLQLNRASHAIARLAEQESTSLVRVSQTVVLLRDPLAATRWLQRGIEMHKAHQAQDVDGLTYARITTEALAGLGDEAWILRSSQSSGDVAVMETFVSWRRGRLVGSVSASVLKPGPVEFDVAPQLQAIASRVGSRMDEAIAVRRSRFSPN